MVMIEQFRRPHYRDISYKLWYNTHTHTHTHTSYIHARAYLINN